MPSALLPNTNPNQDAQPGSTPPNPYQQPTNTGSGTFNPNDPYDTRVGNGALPQGIYGSQNRAYVRDVQPNELSQTQLNNMLDENGRYIQNARNQANQFSNQRGLLNSSIAAGNAESAAVSAAQPFALNDANTYARTASENQADLNAKELADLSSSTQLANTNLNNTAALQRQREKLAYEGEQAGLERAFTLLRDNTLHQYDIDNQNNQTRNSISAYAARTGIDLRTQRIQFFNQLMQHAMDDPELYTPEVVSGMFSAFSPVYSDFESGMDDFFNNDIFGTGGSGQGPGG